jgi:hypothetical protein
MLIFKNGKNVLLTKRASFYIVSKSSSWFNLKEINNQGTGNLSHSDLNAANQAPTKLRVTGGLGTSLKEKHDEKHCCIL